MVPMFQGKEVWKRKKYERCNVKKNLIEAFHFLALLVQKDAVSGFNKKLYLTSQGL